MAVVRLVRFSVQPDRADDMVARRADLITATRQRYPGLLEARLTRIDDQTWLDMWHWESSSHAEAAIKGAPTIPGATAAFELTANMTAEMTEVVDER